MQQDRGGVDQDIKPNQDRRLKPMQGENQQQQPPQQPQKCPRCESLNTKFCYYNNYSLSQPRYFCKTCRRYWTQGGTLRNVPVGGGCRKGKRTKTSSSSSSSGDNSRSQAQQQQPQQGVQQNLTTPQTMISSPALRTKESGNLATPSGISSMGSYYSGGGFLSSLAAIHSLNQPQSFNQHLNQPINVGGGGDLGGSSNLGMLQGFNVPSFGSQQHQGQFYQMGGGDNETVNLMYPSQESLINQSSRPASSSDWHQSFINTTNPTVSDTAMWSISSSTSSTTGNTNKNNNTSGSSSLNPSQWPDLPGCGPPP